MNSLSKPDIGVHHSTFFILCWSLVYILWMLSYILKWIMISLTHTHTQKASRERIKKSSASIKIPAYSRRLEGKFSTTFFFFFHFFFSFLFFWWKMKRELVFVCVDWVGKGRPAASIYLIVQLGHSSSPSWLRHFFLSLLSQSSLLFNLASLSLSRQILFI